MDNDDEDQLLADAAAGEHHDRAARPQTRKDISQLKEKYESNQAVAFEFYGDAALQLDLKTLFLGCRPLMHAYSATLEAHKQGQDRLWGQGCFRSHCSPTLHVAARVSATIQLILINNISPPSPPPAVTGFPCHLDVSAYQLNFLEGCHPQMARGQG